MKTSATIAAALFAITCSAATADERQEVLQNIFKQASGAIAVVRCTVEGDLGNTTIAGQGICIGHDRERGLFITLAMGPRTQTDSIKDLRLTVPGLGGKDFPAELLGIDPETGIAFLRVGQARRWNVVQFASKAAVSPGQQVVSVGLMSESVGSVPYLGDARVSGILRVPEKQVYVTAGRLTNTGSPVFAADGRAIGIIGRQVPLSYTMGTDRGPVHVMMLGDQEAAFFLAVDEFAHVLDKEKIPSSPKQVRRLPWLGVGDFSGVGKDQADAMKLKRPGVMIDRVFAGQPAYKAGLRDRDVIVEMNGGSIEQLGTAALTVQNFLRQLLRKRSGEEITLTVFSGGRSRTVSVTLAPMPKQPYEAKRYGNNKLGLAVREKVAMDDYVSQGTAAKVQGLLVILVARQGPAAAAGLQAGDVVVAADDQQVQTVERFEQVVQAASDRALNLRVLRGDRTRVVIIKPPGS